MICKNCEKEIDDDSKFCEFCQNKIGKDYSYVIKQMEEAVQVSEKRKKLKKVLKNTILVLCVYALSAYIISLSFDKYTPTEVSFVFSIPATILIIFIYNKIAKKFDL